jgi:hypothetical protein
MTLSRGFRGHAGGFLLTAVQVAAAVLVGTAMFAALWAGPAAAASHSRGEPRASASPSPARVKFYIVPRARNGVAESLYAIAARTLGDGNRFMEIFDLNKGRLQPHGGRLENPNDIFAGWILQLPADASGPRVHFGRLPVVSPPPTAPASHRPSRPVARGAGGAAAPHSPIAWAGAGIVIVIAIAIACLTVGFRRRRAIVTGRRRPTHARTPGPRASVRNGAAATTAPDFRAFEPSFPGADHPSFPGADHPSFPGADHPSFPGADHPGWPRALSRYPAPRRQSSPELHHGHRSPAASLSALPGVRNAAGNWGPPDAPPAGTQRWSAPVATTASPATRTHQEVAFGYDQLQVVLTDASADPLRRPAEDFRNADSVWLAGRILSDADDQAAEITRQASDQAAAIRTAAEQDAAETRQQAAAIRTAAEREAAELRATVMTMSADLGRVAAYVTENLTIPAMPATKPAGRPATKPAARPATKPAASPAAKPAARPATKPVARPAAKPGGPPRQYAAMRLTRVVTAALLLFVVIAGTTEIGLHGFSFFVFRAAGTGSTPNSGIKEDQGPGQPDAPGAHQGPVGHRP